MKKHWYDDLWIFSLTYLALDLPRYAPASRRGPVRLWLLQRDADLHGPADDRSLESQSMNLPPAGLYRQAAFLRPFYASGSVTEIVRSCVSGLLAWIFPL